MRKQIPNYQDWETLERPGYFGRRRDEIISEYNRRFGENRWGLMWVMHGQPKADFAAACKQYYEGSYTNFLATHEDVLNDLCRYGEVIDNAPTNIKSGCDYNIQEAFSTHIQDIAIRNAMQKLRRRFIGPRDKILVVRGADSDGFKLGLSPGQVLFQKPDGIIQPSIRPEWAAKNSVEDFWQSNKFVVIPKDR